MNDQPDAAPTSRTEGCGDAGTTVRRDWRIKLITAACFSSLLGLGVTVVHLVWPSPLLFALFMTVGQGALVLAMVLYCVVIFLDLRRRNVL